jgi:hypothetical protein
MVMVPTHAVSGATAWLAGAGATAAVLGYHQSPIELAVYTAVCAGSALLPDLDCSGAVLKNRGGATVARTFGVVSLFVAEVVEKFALVVYRLTSTRHDEKRTNGHRTLTHTWLFNVLLGVGVAALCESVGKPAVIGVLFFTFGLAVRGLMADVARKSGWILVTALSAAAAGLAILTLPADRGYPLLGLAVGAGGVIHTLGDMITRHGCPVIWPIIWRRQRWWEFGVPDAFAVKVDGWFERTILLPALVIGGVAAAAWTIPQVRDLVDSAVTTLASQ